MDLANSPIATNDGDQLNVNDTQADRPFVDSAGAAQPTTSLVSTPTITSTPADSQAQHADVDMDDVEYDDMPGLQDVSDSSNSDYDDDDDDSDVDAREVEMQAMHVDDDDDPPLLPLPHFDSHRTSPSPSSRNRRARVEDDEDNDRDRRHPSHRISAGNNNPGSHPIPTAQTHHGQTLPNDSTFTIMNGFLSYNVGQEGGPGISPPQPSQPAATAQTGATAQPGAGGEAPETRPTRDRIQIPNDTLHGILVRLRDMLSDVGPLRTLPFTFGRGFGFDGPEPEDPERAKRLVDGLEEVPVGLVRRLVRIGGTGGGMGYDDNKGGDSGCAICWDTLLDSEGEGFGKQPNAATEDPSLPDLETKQQPKIVSLPCAHVFHADCLIPWFSRPRHTTCPTCRFNIDPDNLTYNPELLRSREQEQEQEQGEEARTTDGAPPVAETNTPQAPNFSVERDFVNWFPQLPANTANPSAPTVSPNATTATAVPGPNTGVAGPTSDGQQSSMSFQTPNGFVTVTQVVTPFDLHPQGGNPAHPHGTRRLLFHSRPIIRTDERRPLVGPISIPFPQAQAPRPGQVPQSQTQSEPVPAGEYTRLFSRLGRQDPHPPLNSLFPAPFFHLGGQPQPQPQATEAQPAEPVNRVPGQFVRASIRPARTNYFIPVLVYRRCPSLQLGPGTQAPLPPLPNHTPMPNIPRMFSPFDLLNRRPATNPANATPTAAAPGTTPASGVNQAPAPAPADPNSTNNAQDQTEFMQVTFDMVIGPWQPLGQGGQPFAAPQAPPSGAPQNAGATPPAPAAPGQTSDQQVPLRPVPRTAETLDEELRDVLAALRANVGTREGSQGQPQPSDDQPPAETEADDLPGFALEEDTQRLLEETRRNVDIFLSRMMDFRLRPAPDEAPVDAQPQGERQRQANPDQPPQVPVEPNAAQPPPPLPQMQFQTFSNFDFLGGGDGREERSKRQWTLPPAPGPSLRQRIERRELEAGLRCNDISCGVGPSDEEPFPSALADHAGAMKRLFIKAKGVAGKDVCSHAFHSGCLVSTERVAFRGAEPVVDSDGCVEVSCPVCRSVGCVLKEEWDEGVVVLQ